MQTANTYSHETCAFCLAISHAKLSRISPSGIGRHEAYFLNQELSFKLWVVLSGIELTLRNRGSTYLIAEFGEELFSTEAWRLGEALKSRISKVLARSKDGQPSTDAVITQLPLSFWTLLFSKRMESTTWPVLMRNLLSDSAPTSRAVIYTRLLETVELRNRIAHHEVVLKARFKGALERQLELLSWVCNDFRQEVEARIEFSLHPVESLHEQ